MIGGRLSLNSSQAKALRKTLAGLDMPRKKRQRLLWRMASLGIIPASKRHARNQTSPDGQPWEPRQRGKKKMLLGLAKLLKVKELPEQEAVRIYLQGGDHQSGGKRMPAGYIGAVHDAGATIKASAANYKSQPSQAGQKATKRQAKKLRELGFKVKWGERRVKPAVSYITAQMSRAQAGYLIKKLSKAEKKNAWTITLPSRVFLGVSDDEFNNIMARQLQGIGFGWDVNAQDIKGRNS